MTNSSGGPSRPDAAGLLRFTLAGLPELEMFPTAGQRDAALASVVAGITPAGRAWWTGFAILVGGVAAVGIPARILVPRLGLPRWSNDLILMALIGGCVFFVIRWLHRWGAQRVLRERLLDAGVAVCTHCGYDLRGQPSEPLRCPECGRPMDPRAAAIVTSSANPRP